MNPPIPGAPVVPATPAPVAAPVQPVQTPPVSAPVIQPPPVARPGVPATPAPVQPTVTTVPLRELQDERDKRQALQAELENLRRAPVNPQQQPYQQPQQQYQPVAAVDPRVELEKLWDTDPRKAVQVEIMYAMDWRDRQEASLNQQADVLAQQYPDFNNYRTSALAFVRSLPAHQRGSPGVLNAAYFMTRGQNVDSLLKQQEQDWLGKYQRGEITAQQLQQPAGGYSVPPVAPGTVTLTQDQLAAAQMMRMTPEQYAAQIKSAPGGAR